MSVSSHSIKPNSYEETMWRTLKMDPETTPPQVREIEVECSPMYALLIGINNYHSSRLRRLGGAVADVNAVEHYLRAKLHVSENRIIALRDEQATRYRILDELHNLCTNPNIKTGDPILIYFAGHGTTAQAPVGWKSKGGEIQAIVPCDCYISRCTDSPPSDDHIQPIPDRTLGAMLHKISQGIHTTDNESHFQGKGDNITVILDCCYAGSGTRDSDPVSESQPSLLERGFKSDSAIPATLDETLWKVAEGDRATAALSNFDLAGSKSHILLAACSDTQTARELNNRGLFTSALLSALAEVPTDRMTYKDLLHRIQDIPGQTPRFEGSNIERFLFDARSPSKGQALYQLAEVDGKYLLRAGTAHGIAPDVLLAIYLSTDFKAEEKPLATCRVLSTRPFESSITLLPPSTSDTLHIPGVAYALQMSFADNDKLKLCVPLNDTMESVFLAVSKDFELGAIQFTTSDEEADLTVVAASNGLLTYQVTDQLISKYGITELCFQTKRNPADIYSVIHSAVYFFRYLHRKSPARGELYSKIKFEFHLLEETTMYDRDIHPIFRRKGNSLIKNGMVELEADNKTGYGMTISNCWDVGLYVGVFYFDCSDLSITEYYVSPIHVKEEKGEAPLPPHQNLGIGYGDSGTRPCRYRLHGEQSFDVGFLKLFISTEPIDFSDVPQQSPEDVHRDSPADLYRPTPKRSEFWDAIEIPLLQRKPKGK